MEIKKQIDELIKAQDIVRQVYANQENYVLDIWLRMLDKDFSKIINKLGEKIEDSQID